MLPGRTVQQTVGCTERMHLDVLGVMENECQAEPYCSITPGAPRLRKDQREGGAAHDLTAAAQCGALVAYACVH